MRHLLAASLFLIGCVVGCGAGPQEPPTVAITPPPAVSAKPISGPPAQECTLVTPRPADDVIERVQVRGLVRSKLKEVCAALRTRAGSPLQEENVHADAQFLWESGLFADLDIASEIAPTGRSVTITLRERPEVRRWAIHGVPDAESERITKLLELHPEELFEPQMVRARVAQLMEDLVSEGYRRADVQFKVSDLPNNEVEVDLNVNEGPRALIKQVTLNGVKQAKEADLRALLDKGDGELNSAVGSPCRSYVLERARYRILDYYYDHGMITADVHEETVALSADGAAATVTIDLTEGPVYKIGKLACSGDLAVSQKQCVAAIGLKKGAIFNRSQLKEAIDRVRKLQADGNHGQSVEPQTTVDPTKRVVDLTFSISK
jgi:outer membrane protein insertion porin family